MEESCAVRPLLKADYLMALVLLLTSNRSCHAEYEKKEVARKTKSWA
jgi:hypothetical protein